MSRHAHMHEIVRKQERRCQLVVTERGSDNVARHAQVRAGDGDMLAFRAPASPAGETLTDAASRAALADDVRNRDCGEPRNAVSSASGFVANGHTSCLPPGTSSVDTTRSDADTWFTARARPACLSGSTVSDAVFGRGGL